MNGFSTRTRRGDAGFVVVATALALVVLAGIAGLGIDLARMYIARNELQAYVDAAALAASQQLDGSSAHLGAARTTAQNYPNKWGLGANKVTGVKVGFALTGDGVYEEYPSTGAGYRFVRVQASGTVPLYLLPVIRGIGKEKTVQAEARAGQTVLNATGLGDGLLPYSPEAYCAAPNGGCAPANDYGFSKGKPYTLRWPPPGQRDKKGNWCEGDLEHNYTTSSGAGDRGYIDIGDGTGASKIRNAIVNNSPNTIVEIGQPIVSGGGNKGTESDALRTRFNQDTDTTSANYAEYSSRAEGNGRRFGIVAINNPSDDTVLGFGLFFLLPDTCGSSNVATCCAEYVGPAQLPGLPAAGPAGQVYQTRLIY